MAIKDILLPLVGEPDAAAIAAIDKCMAVAGDIGARVTAIAVEEDILARPKVTILADLDNAAAAEAVRSVSNAHGLLEAFDAAASRFGVRNEQRIYRFAAADISANFAVFARLKDLSLVPVKSHDSRSEKIVEGLIFESGRPILMCPEEFAAELTVAFDDVVIAWDHTRAGRESRGRRVAMASGGGECAHLHRHRQQDAGRTGIRDSAREPFSGARH